MGTWWNSFMEKYETEMLTISKAKLLEAFWYYCQQYQKDEYLEKCNKIMKES